MSRVSHAIDRIRVSFDEPNLVANAGLLLWDQHTFELAEAVGGELRSSTELPGEMQAMRADVALLRADAYLARDDEVAALDILEEAIGIASRGRRGRGAGPGVGEDRRLPARARRGRRGSPVIEASE